MIRENTLLLRDAISALLGQDYFHRRQPVGRFAEDPRCYYNDLRAKAMWRGRTADGIPLLYAPRLGIDIAFPIMILQYGLGCLDCHFTRGGSSYLGGVDDVWRWIVGQLAQRDHFHNQFPLLNPSIVFHSDNSGMAQGQALSFLSRLRRYLPERYSPDQIDPLLERIHDDIWKPVDRKSVV